MCTILCGDNNPTVTTEKTRGKESGKQLGSDKMYLKGPCNAAFNSQMFYMLGRLYFMGVWASCNLTW